MKLLSLNYYHSWDKNNEKSFCYTPQSNYLGSLVMKETMDMSGYFEQEIY